MAATGWLIGRRLRRTWLTLLLLALIVGLGGAAALVSLGAAERTTTAYARYVDRADVGDVVLNPDVNDEVDELIRSLPGVTSVTSDAIFSASLDDGAPRTVGELEFTQTRVVVLGSIDGRHTTMDRPALAEGTLPDGPDEAVVSRELADDLGVGVGDVLPVSFWGVREQAFQDPDTVVSPLAVEHLEIVGVGMLLPDLALPDELFPLQAMIVSPDVAARYHCVPQAPADADATAQTADAVFAALYPEGCATLFWDYSLDLADGEAGVAAVRDAVVRYNAEQRARSPQDSGAYAFATGSDAEPQGLFVASTTAQERDRVQRSVQPIVAALVVLGGAAAIITAIVAGLIAARELRRTQVEQSQWWHLGSTRAARAGAVIVPLLVAVAAGLVGAIVAAWWLSPLGPVGSVRSVEPGPGRGLAGWTWLGALGLAVVLVAEIVGPALRSVRETRRAPDRASAAPRVQRLIGASARPEVAEGIRAAFGRRGSGLVVAGGAVAATVFLVAAVFATSLSSLVSTPRSYGWPWDVGVIVGLGWGGADLATVGATLDDRDDVEGWTGLGFTDAVTLGGEPVFAMVTLDRRSPVGVTVIEGRLPAAAGEVAIGSRTAADHDIGVGDEVPLGGDLIEPATATVTGRVVLPALGPNGGERASPGTGLLLPAAMLADSAVETAIGFIGIGLAPDADPDAVRRDLQDELAAWDTFFERPLLYAEPVRPSEIVDTRSMRAVPLVVGGLLVVAASIGLASAMVASVRARRRQLATLRALGFTRRQILDSVRVQTVVTMIAALLVGAPIGIALGRVAWRGFASQLGVLPDPTVPGVWTLATGVGAIIIALTAAAVAARVATRGRPLVELRSE